MNLVSEKNDLRGYHLKGVVRADPAGRYGIELLFDAEGKLMQIHFCFTKTDSNAEI